MARELNLYVDSERGALVSGFTSTIPASLAPFKFGDSVPVICRVLTPDTSSSIRPYKEFDLTDRELRVGIGVPAGLPTVGTFTLTYGANTTSAISFDADATAVQTALNALASITSAGGVTVTKPSDGVYRIVFNTTGDRTEISGDTSSLYPTTGAFIGVAQQGTGTLKEVVLVSLETQPAAYVLLEDELPVAAIGVTVVRAGASGVGEIQTIDLSTPEPYDGTFSLEIDGNATPAIAYNALSDEVQSAIEAASEDYVGEVTVTGTFPRYTISFGSTLGALGAMTADASDLVVPKGRKGSLNLNTTGVIELLNGEASATAKLEIEILDLDDSTPWTVIQQDVTVNQDVIPNSPASQTPLPVYVTPEGISSLIEDQFLASSRKAQPENSDLLLLSDSSSSGETKSLGWSDLKASILFNGGSISLGGITIVMTYGQSNAYGSDSIPALTTTDVYDCLRFSTGVRASGSGATLDGLVESASGSLGETPCSGFAMQWTEDLPVANETKLFLSSGGQGGLAISGLVKGTAPYTALIEQAQNATALCEDDGGDPSVAAIVFIQGETDAGGGTTQEDYLTSLKGLKEDLQVDLSEITGRAGSLHMALVQPSANILTSAGTALAQLEACESDPFFTLVVPAYALPHATNVHYSNLGSQMAGRYAGRALKQVVANGTLPPALMPLGASSKGREIIWRFRVPKPPLVFDVTNLTATPSYGFQVEDETGVVPMASIEALADGVRIVAARDLDGATEVRYALDLNGTGIVNGASGNLADSTPDTFWVEGVEYGMPYVAPHAKRSVRTLRHDASDAITPAAISDEDDAFGHWILGGTSASLSSVVNAEVLTPMGNAPTYNATSVVMTSGHVGGYLGLQSNLVDQQDQTILVVVKRPANPTGSNANHFCGTLDLLGNVGSGIATWALVTASQITMFQAGGANYSAPFTDAFNGGAIGDWLCLIYRQSATKYGMIASSDKNRAFHDIAQTRTLTSNKIAVAGGYTGGYLGNAISIEIAEAIIWDKTLTVSECFDALTRSRQRMAQRGISF